MVHEDMALSEWNYQKADQLWDVLFRIAPAGRSWQIDSFQTAAVSDATETSADADDAAEADEACAEHDADEERNQNPPVKWREKGLS